MLFLDEALGIHLHGACLLDDISLVGYWVLLVWHVCSVSGQIFHEQWSQVSINPLSGSSDLSFHCND